MKAPVFGCALFALALGCGKSDSEKFVDAYCGEFAKCCSQAGLSGDGKMCRTLFSGAGSSYNATAGDACLAQMKADVAAGTFCTAPTPPSCNSVYGTASSGNKKPGDPCDFDSQCAASSDGQVVCASLYANGTFIDKCQVRMTGKVGDACLGTQNGDTFMGVPTDNATDVPARGYVCNVADGLQCASGTCVALRDVGAPCTTASDCVTSAFCDYLQGKCTARVAAGGPCGTSSDTECVDGYYCDSIARQCSAKLANGATCSGYNMCQSSYCNNTCQINPLATLGLGLICGT